MRFVRAQNESQDRHQQAFECGYLERFVASALVLRDPSFH
jgi:hypothetical protein